MRDGMVEPKSRDQTLRRERGQGKFRFPCSADHKQDWQPFSAGAQSAENDDHTDTHTHAHVYRAALRTTGPVSVLGSERHR